MARNQFNVTYGRKLDNGEHVVTVVKHLDSGAVSADLAVTFDLSKFTSLTAIRTALRAVEQAIAGSDSVTA